MPCGGGASRCWTGRVSDPSARSLINSGQLAEPYWYTASPLTTPGPSLAGFPAEPGAQRPPVPGVLCPDGHCDPGSPTRLRRLFGRSFVLLTARAATAAAALQAAEAAIAAPVTAYALDDIDHSGELGPALAATPDSVHVVRPDGHLAAVLPAFTPASLTTALRRAVGAASHER